MRKKLQPHQKRFLETVMIAAVISLLPYIYFQPEYEQLKETDITIEWTYYSAGRGSIGSFIRTSDDVVFKVSGDISSRAAFEDKLVPDTNAQIKYYRGILVFVPMQFIEELTVNGETIITYKNQQVFVQIICAIVGGIVLVVGFLFYADSEHLLKKIRKKYRKDQKKQKKISN